MTATDIEADVAAWAIIAVDWLGQRISRPHLDILGKGARLLPAGPAPLWAIRQAHAPQPP